MNMSASNESRNISSTYQFGDREIVCLIWYISLFCLGVPINGVAIFSLLVLRKSRLDQYWVLLLCFSDFLLAWTNGIAKAPRLIYFLLHSYTYMTSGLGCQFIGALNYICLGMTTLILEIIAVDRCLIIVKQATYTSFTMRHRQHLVGLSYLLIFGLPVLAISLPLAGVGSRIFFNISQLTCSLESTVYKFIAFGVFIIFPLVVMIFMYSAILFYFFQHQRRVGAAAGQLNQGQKRGGMPSVNKGDIRLVQTMVIIVITYCVCLLPFTVLSIFRVKSWMALSLSTAFGYSTVVANPCIYFIINRNMRQAVFLAFKFKRYTINPEKTTVKSMLDTVG